MDMPAHKQTNFRPQNIAHADRCYQPHTTRTKQHSVLKGKHILSNSFFFFYWSIFLYFSFILVFLHLQLTHFFLVIDSK